MRGKLFSILIAMAVGVPMTAGAFEGFVKIAPERELFVQWDEAQEGQPTVILLNGLTYSTKQFASFRKELIKSGIGVVRYDMMGMGQTLLKYAPVVSMISYEDQVKDLKKLIEALEIETPVNLVGLSYGGGIAMAFAARNPKLVKSLMLMAPFTEPVASQDQWIKSQVWYTRKVYPLNPYSDDDLYDYFLRQIVYTTYPAAEPIVLENPFKLEATFRMVQGIRKWRADRDVAKLPKKSVHLLIAENDQYIERNVLETFWEAVPVAQRGSKSVLKGSEHKIPEAKPSEAARWVKGVLNGKK
ncbi:MAG: alpha/beta hydrolase [Proteobacteria bacterium]|jgi:pimeloyl-ACP methyl ester carboxylesterase|nr:alpha/beta hydrolase [Pseudomonadota bacterium]